VVLPWLAACGARDWKAVDARLKAAAAEARAAGYSPLAGPTNTFGTFRDSTVTVWTVPLEAGRTVFLAGACTDGCDALDFVVSGPRGDSLASDTSAGATPRLEFTPPTTGPYEVQVRTGACAADACRWLLQLYGR
jgi:hypothetical protein